MSPRLLWGIMLARAKYAAFLPPMTTGLIEMIWRQARILLGETR